MKPVPLTNLDLTARAGFSHRLGQLLGFILMAASASGATWPVTESISQAVNLAQPGDTVLVTGPGTFHERVVIGKSIRLVGTNFPAIDADGVGTVMTVTAPDCELSGLAVVHSGHDLTAFDSGIMIRAPRVTVRECRIESDGFGVYVRGVNDCRIQQNEIFGGTNLASAARGNGIHLWNTRRNRILGNSIHNKRDGMYFSYADDNLIAENRVWDTRFGIHYMYSHQNRLLSNSLTGNAVGATLMFSRQSLVQDNLIVANRRHGIVLKQVDNSKILGNVICGQNRGLFVQQANQNRFEGNFVGTNDIALYISNASEQNVLVGNSFVRNTKQVWQPPFETGQGRKGPNLFTEKGRGNFWSDYTGADRNHDGIGDTPYHETDVFGYIVDRHPAARVFALSPAVALLRKGEELLPLLDTTGVTDTAPLMRPVGAGVASSSRTTSNQAAAERRLSAVSPPRSASVLFLFLFLFLFLVLVLVLPGTGRRRELKPIGHKNRSKHQTIEMESPPNLIPTLNPNPRASL